MDAQKQFNIYAASGFVGTCTLQELRRLTAEGRIPRTATCGQVKKLGSFVVGQDTPVPISSIPELADIIASLAKSEESTPVAATVDSSNPRLVNRYSDETEDILRIGWGDFLKGHSLRDWEQVALRSFGALANIRQSLGLFFVLLALNVIGRLVLMGNVSPGLQTHFVMDLSGFIVVGILALITFFTPRWWMVLITAIAIFPFALGIITGIMAVGLLCMIPMLKRANQELYLSAADYDAMKAAISGIAAGQQADLWPEIGKLANNAVRVHFFDNSALFLLGKKPLNTILTTDAAQCVIEVNKKGKKFLKQWLVQGRVKKTNIPLSDDGHTRLQDWLAKSAMTALPATV
jgi:hypothetical protein